MMFKFLVVEDDNHINEVISEYLKDANYDVLSYINGGEASHYIESNEDIDFFILDIMLPEISGIELLRRIRRKAAYEETPVIMLTALSDEQTQLNSFEEKADDYINKPFSPKVLLKRIEVLLRRTGALRSYLKVGQIMMELDSHKVYEDQREIVLTLKEFELLRILMSNTPKVLNRQQLLNLVWGYDYFGDDRIVDVHIKNLRKKFDRNVIFTVKGIGYKVEKNSEDD
jgi:two-component system response regulator VanR